MSLQDFISNLRYSFEDSGESRIGFPECRWPICQVGESNKNNVGSLTSC